MPRPVGLLLAASILAPLTLSLTGCRNFDRYDRVTEDDGLVPAEQFAAYGAEQAQAVAIGRAFGASWTGPSVEERVRQAEVAAEYARGLRDVVSVQVDSVGALLTVTFTSGWRKAVVPIDDGVPADQTVGLPPAR